MESWNVRKYVCSFQICRSMPHAGSLLKLALRLGLTISHVISPQSENTHKIASIWCAPISCSDCKPTSIILSSFLYQLKGYDADQNLISTVMHTHSDCNFRSFLHSFALQEPGWGFNFNFTLYTSLHILWYCFFAWQFRIQSSKLNDNGSILTLLE